MGSSRDDFSAATLRAAAGRVGYRCSFPGCKQVTIGPSMESDTKLSNIGVGAHICAAAKGGPRYDPAMSSSERKHVSNCIWLCQTHAHLIDTDVVRYSIDTLRKWKKDAEDAAILALEGAESVTDFYSLSDNSIEEFKQFFEYLINEGQYQQLYAKLHQFQQGKLSLAFYELVLRYTIFYDSFCRHNRISEDLSLYLAQNEKAGIDDLARLFISFIMPDQYFAIKDYIRNEQLIKAGNIVFSENCGELLFNKDNIALHEIQGEDNTLTRARLFYIFKINGIAPPETLDDYFLEFKQGFFYRVLYSIGRVLSSIVYERNSPAKEQDSKYLLFLTSSADAIENLEREYQIYYWKYVLSFLTGNDLQFYEMYSKCPDGLKTDPAIEKVRLQHAIATAPHEQNDGYLLRFAEENNYYDLILRYLASIDTQEATDFINEHLYLLGKDINILFFRVFVLNDLPQEQRRALLEKYSDAFSTNFLYHCMVAYEYEEGARLESELAYLETQPQFGEQEAELYIKVLYKNKKWDKLAALSNKLFPYELQYYIAIALTESGQDIHIKTAADIFDHLCQGNWHRAGLKKDYANALYKIGKTEAAKKLLREEYDEFSDLSALHGLIQLRLFTNSNNDDEYFRALSAYCDAKSMCLTGEVFLKRKEYQQAYDFYLRSLLVDDNFLASCFGIFKISIHNKLPPVDSNCKDKKIVVLLNDTETRRIAIHSPNTLHGITPSQFAGCEHYSIEDPIVSCLVFSNVHDKVTFENKQYVVENITSLQDAIVKKCFEVVLNDPNITKIQGETAEDFVRAIEPILQSSKDAITTVLSEYNDAILQMPLTALAKATGKSMLEITEFLMYGNKSNIRNNQNSANSDTEDTIPTFVFAYDAIIHLFELELCFPDKVKTICPIQVRNHLSKDIDDKMREILSDNHPGNMSFQDGKLTILEYTDSIRQERYLHLSRFKEFLNSVPSPQESYDYNSIDDEIGAKVAEIILGGKLLCESGALGLAQSLNNTVLVTDDQLLYCAAQHSGIRSCGVTGFLSVSGFSWDQLLEASKKLKKMNYANYLPFELYKAIVDAMLDEGEEDIDKKSALIQGWIRTGGDEKPTEQHKDIILDLLRNVVQSKLAYLNPGFFLSELAAPIIEERNPGMLQQFWEKVCASLPEKLYDLLTQSIDFES